MNTTLRVFFIVAILAFLAIIINYLIKKKLNLKYTLVWLATVVCMLIVVLFPRLIEKIASLLGIVSVVNAVFLFAGMFSLLIILTLTAIVSHMNNRVYRLTQTQAILQKRIRELEEKEAGESENGKE
ncbi:MAG: DUF2304 domain-containing protein [Clostridia bacterium]|nr:DUF2304 domain-containing protein [Clostridia bacterium]